MNLKKILLLTFLSYVNISVAQEFKPPYLAHSSNWIMTMFKVKTSDVRTFLPQGIKPQSDENGMTNLGLEIYELDDISGLPVPYFVSFIFVQVESVGAQPFPSNFPIWGVFNDTTAANGYATHFGFPFKHYQSSFSLTKEDNKWVGIIGDKKLITLEITQTPEKTKNVGVAKMVSEKNNAFMYSSVAWINNGYVTSKTKLKIDPQGDPVLELIKGATPFWSLVSDNQIFTYTNPTLLLPENSSSQNK